jgi:arsenate reductase
MVLNDSRTDSAPDDVAPRAGDEDRQQSKLAVQHEMLLRGIANRFEGEFGEMFTRDTLLHLCRDSYQQMASSAKVLNHLPAFVERFSRQRLRALAKTRRSDGQDVPEVLFVCTRNDAASQMAAGLFALHAQDRAVAHSAGTSPSAEVLVSAVAVMHEVGVDLAGELPKPVTTEIERAADVVVTLSAHDDVPVVDDTRFVAWRTTEIDTADLDACRRLRDELDVLVRGLVEEIAPARLPSRRAFDEELAALETQTFVMGRAVMGLLDDAASALVTADGQRAEALHEADAPVDVSYAELEHGVVDVIARRQPVAVDLRRLVALLRTSLHLERIGDCAVDVARAVHDAGEAPPPDAVIERLSEMARAVLDAVEAALNTVETRDRDRCSVVASLATSVEAMQDRIAAMLVDSPPSDEGRAWLLAADRISRIYARAAAHALDIAEASWYRLTGELRELGRTA